MSGSTVPGTISALLAHATSTKPDGADLGVGEPVEVDGLFMALAWSGDPDGEGVSFRDTEKDGGGSQQIESYDIRAEISDWTGDEDPVAAMTSVFGWYDDFYAALAADRNLGRTVDKATVSAGQYTASSSDGAVGTLRFTIHVNAWRTA